MHATQPVLDRPPALRLAARKALREGLARAGGWIETHGKLTLGLLLALYLLAELGYSLAAPLWHDELFTFYIAQAPSTRAMLALTRRVDLNPPLSYLLTRLSFKLFGVGTLQCRLPEIAGFALGLAAIFTFVRRRAGAAFGLMAAALFFSSRAGDLIMQARPYGLMLGTSALALVSWQSASDPATKDRWRANIGLLLALTALLLTHVFGLLFWASLALAEAVQCFQNRRVDLQRSMALLVPLLATLSYVPLLRNHAQSAFPPAFQPTGNDIFGFYIGHMDRELVCLWLSALLIVVVAGRSWLRGTRRFVLTTPEWFAISGCIAAPLVLIVHLMIDHGAFFDRYGVIACLGCSILFAVLFCWWTGGRAGAALVATVIALLITARIPDALTAVAEGHIFKHTEPVVEPLDISRLANPALPLVIASGLTFLEMQEREPRSLLDRTVHLQDPAAALRYAHATIFGGLPEEVQLFKLHRNTQGYSDFLSQHPAFYVLGTYDYPEDWLLRKLQADGARMEVLGRIDDSYKDHELYLVHLHSAAAIP